MKNPVRFLGLDFGDKTIGVSVSSPCGKIATGVTTLTRQNADTLRPNLKDLKAIIKEYGITAIVLGYPINLDGSKSLRCEKTLSFKEKLNRYFKSIPVELWDERLSTQAVTRSFKPTGKSNRYKKYVDEMAAVYILQGYLNKEANASLTVACSRASFRKGDNIMEDNMKINENDGDDATIVLYDDDGNEVVMQILSSRQDGDVTYVLVAEENEEESEVMHFKLIDDGEDDTIFELVDEEHEDFERVLELFKDDYETLDIEIDEIEI